MIENYLGLGHIYHSRKEGARNNFRYPSFFLLFSCAKEQAVQDYLSRKCLNILSIRTEDYLSGHSGSLSTNIKRFLKERCNGYDPEDVWLHTLPRMFGYAFNPVSFWFCRREGRLEAVLVEVNNTFGERHFYWINPAGGIDETKWYRTEKLFHVSPFFPVDGHYQFRFQLSAENSRVDINHHAPSEQMRLATWIEGQHSPLQTHSLISIVLKYGWITPMVVFRIHFQAIKLWIKKTKFHSKPKLPSKEVSS